MENIIDFKRLHHKLSAKEVADIESMTRKEIFILRGMKRWIKNERLSGYGE